MVGVSRMKEYDNCRKSLKRLKVDNPSSVCLLLFEKIVNSQYPTRFHAIRAEDVKQYGIIPSKKHQTFSSWRLEMINLGILVCMGAKEDFREDSANHKAGMFKFGDTIKKYIEAALHEKLSVFERIDTKADNEFVEKQLALKASNEEMNELKNTVQDLEKKVQAMVELVLEALPPDTPVRRRIAAEHYKDKKACVDALKQEKKSHKKTKEESKKNTDLRIVC